MLRRLFSPLRQFTAADILHTGLGLLMVPLGVIILARTLSIAVTVPGVLIGSAFIAFGTYRLWLAWSGYRLCRDHKRQGGR